MKGGVGTAEINNGTCARFVEDGCWWFHQYWGKNQMEILIDIEHPSLDTLWGNGEWNVLLMS